MDAPWMSQARLVPDVKDRIPALPAVAVFLKVGALISLLLKSSVPFLTEAFLACQRLRIHDMDSSVPHYGPDFVLSVVIAVVERGKPDEEFAGADFKQHFRLATNGRVLDVLSDGDTRKTPRPITARVFDHQGKIGRIVDANREPRLHTSQLQQANNEVH